MSVVGGASEEVSDKQQTAVGLPALNPVSTLGSGHGASLGLKVGILEDKVFEEGTEASPRRLSSESLSSHHRGIEKESPIPEDDVLDLSEREGEEEVEAEAVDDVVVELGVGEDRVGSGGASTSAAAIGSSGSGIGASPALPSRLRPGSVRSAPSSPGSTTMSPKKGSNLKSISVGGPGSSSSSSSKYSPLPWSNYFEESFPVELPNGDVFNMYKAGSEGPVVFCLHGGGYSGLSFAVAAAQIRQQQQRGASWGLPGSPSSSIPSITIVAMDLRGHGLTRTQDDSDLSAETLCGDVIRVVTQLYPTDPPPLVLVGHSMGGAIAIRVAAMNSLPSLSGLVVVDVVEGTAMASLVHMQAILAARPTRFPSLEKAVEWTLRNGHIRNPESARVSVPSTLVLDSTTKQYVWRAPLEESEKFWRGWYTGLSEAFLHSHVPKVLLLAGTDRLDKTLTIAQMQGKFQMLVVRHSGHAIQEDEPVEFASSVLHFIARNRINTHGTLFARWGGPIHP